MNFPHSEQESNLPGNSANMFGKVLPIQNGIWNWAQVSNMNMADILVPKRRATARCKINRPHALIVVRVNRTVHGTESTTLKPRETRNSPTRLTPGAQTLNEQDETVR